MDKALLGIDSADTAWLGAVGTVLSFGNTSQPRGQKTRELLGHSVNIDMSRPVLTVARRRLGYRFLAAEAAWILSGDNRVETIAPYAAKIADFSDDGQTFFGAYGPKVLAQLGYVVDTLIKDPDSRQAVLNIWRENPPASKDIPCTLSAQFMIRGGQIHAVVSMRSSDLWLGLPYDLFNFSMLAAWVGLEISRRGGPLYSLGTLTNFAGSRHLYERDWDQARACVADRRPAFQYDTVDTVDFGSPGDLVEHLWALAEQGQGRRRFRSDALVEILRDREVAHG